MRPLYNHEFLFVVGGADDVSGLAGSGCEVCDSVAAEAKFNKEMQAFQERYEKTGFGDGAVIGSAIGAGFGGKLAGNAGSAVGGAVGNYGGRFAEAGFPFKEYFEVKEAYEKNYGIQ